MIPSGPLTSPVVIQSSRAKIALMLLAGVALVATGLALIVFVPDFLAKAIGVIGVGFFGWCVIAAARQWLTPSTLTLTPSGFAVTGIKDWSRTWDKVGPFSIMKVQGTKLVVFDYVEDSPHKASKAARLSQGMTGVDAGLPTGWTLPPDALADLMNRARTQWAVTPSPVVAL